MAVETRYIVIRTDRSNKEQEVMTFTDKRSADEYDKMLDMADDMFSLLESSGLELNEQQCEALSIFLAKQKDDVLIALQAKKKSTASVKKPKKQQDLLDTDSADSQSDNQTSLSEKIRTESKSKKSSAKTDDVPIDFVIEKDDAA